MSAGRPPPPPAYALMPAATEHSRWRLGTQRHAEAGLRVRVGMAVAGAAAVPAVLLC